jgi:glyoxylase-like metal-dependent hydrolase (beta-lactamase superfamily II)
LRPPGLDHAIKSSNSTRAERLTGQTGAVDTARLTIGTTTLERVTYAEILVPPEAVSLTADNVRSIPWGEPLWAEDGQVRVAAAAWVIESGGRRIVVDPAQAADNILREGADAVAHQEAFANLLAGAGYERESIDTVVATHLDGIGMMAWRDDDKWVPFFPNAKVLVTRREYEFTLTGDPFTPPGADALIALHDLGAVELLGDLTRLTDDVTLRWTGGHTPGHQVVEIASGDTRVTMVGHLALSPLNGALECAGHIDSAQANTALRERRDRGDVLIGPLWPLPGAARWDGVQMQPVTAG